MLRGYVRGGEAAFMISDPQTVRRLIRATRGRIFLVVFIKRKDRTTRRMRARIGVRIGLKGDPVYSEQIAKQDLDHDLSRVWDVEVGEKDPERAYRSVPLERVLHLSCGDIEYFSPVATRRI